MIATANDSNLKNSDDVRAFFDELLQDTAFSLPMLPETTSQLLSLCNDPNTPPEKLAESIHADLSVAANVLRLANSAVYGVGTPIVSLKQAVTRFGIRRLREIVLIVSCRGQVFEATGFEDEVRASFHRCLTTAVLAQETARMRRMSVEDAFLTGLLHDVGRPVLLQLIADHLRENTVTYDRDSLLSEVTRRCPEIGGELLKQWKLPDRIADAVSNQLEETNNATNEVQLLNLARALADLVLDSQELDREDIYSLPVIEELNLYPEQVDDVLNKSEELIDLMGWAS